MSAITFPFTYRALGNDDLAASLKFVTKTVDALRPGQLLVRVTQASVNYMDTGMQRMNFFQLPMPLVLGFDVAGTVAALGPEGSDGAGWGDLAVGTAVVGVAERAGSFAEYVVLSKNCVVPSNGVPGAESSTFGIAGATTYEGVEMEMKVSQHKGKTILIPGAAGGCGHFAVMLAKRAGLRVIGTCSKDSGAALLKEIGADLVIDYSKQDVVKEVMAFTDGKGADLVWDSTYQQSSIEQGGNALAKGGHFYILGTAPQYAMRGMADFDALFKNARERGAATATNTDYGRWLEPNSELSKQKPNIRADIFTDLVKLYKDGSVKPRITKVVKFEPAALQAVFDDWKNVNVGKVVVQVA